VQRKIQRKHRCRCKSASVKRKQWNPFEFSSCNDATTQWQKKIVVFERVWLERERESIGVGAFLSCLSLCNVTQRNATQRSLSSLELRVPSSLSKPRLSHVMIYYIHREIWYPFYFNKLHNNNLYSRGEKNPPDHTNKGKKKWKKCK